LAGRFLRPKPTRHAAAYDAYLAQLAEQARAEASSAVDQQMAAPLVYASANRRLIDADLDPRLIRFYTLRTLFRVPAWILFRYPL